MRNKKNRCDAPSYASTFKPAMVLGAPTINDLMNRTYLRQHQEEFDAKGSQKTKYLEEDEVPDPDMNSFYTLQTEDPNVKLILRPVIVEEKEDYTYTYLVEPELNARGISIVLMKKAKNGKEIYCNVRYLPYSTLKDILSTSTSDEITVELPSENIVKLNVTLKPSNVGEVLYQTHKTEVNLENTTKDEIIKLKQQLEFETAKQVAHFATQLLEVTHSENSEDFSQINLSIEELLSEKSWSYIKKSALVVAAVCTAVAGAFGGLAIAVPTMTAAKGVAVGSGAFGGFLRNFVGLSNVFGYGSQPVMIGKSYTLETIEEHPKRVRLIEN